MKAFPHKVYLETTDPTVQNPVIHAGMDLRDYFAAKAMEAFLTDLTHKQDVFLLDEVADTAYAMADAMMKAREQ